MTADAGVEGRLASTICVDTEGCISMKVEDSPFCCEECGSHVFCAGQISDDTDYFAEVVSYRLCSFSCEKGDFFADVWASFKDVD